MNYQPFDLDTLVELQDQYSNVYPLSPTGARGWVRARRELPKQDPEVFIEWDKNHWRYHGEKDGWTFEHHFRQVEDPVLPAAPVQPDMHEILQEAHRKLDSERCEHCGSLHDEPHEFIETLMDAEDAAIGSDGYFIITLTPQRHGDTVVFQPEIFSQALTPTAKAMIEAQLVQIASQLFQNVTVAFMEDLEGGPDEP